MKNTYDWLPAFVGGEAEWRDNSDRISRGRIASVTVEKFKINKKEFVRATIVFSLVRIRKLNRDTAPFWAELEKGCDQNVIMQFEFENVTEWRDERTPDQIARRTTLDEPMTFSMPRLNQLPTTI